MDSRAVGDGAGGGPDASSPADPPSPEPDPSAGSMDARLPADLLRAVLQRLPPIDLARSACVCRAWRAVASDRAVVEAAFCAPWGVRRVVGEPATGAFWRTACLGRFALSHAVRRGDTVPGVALKYSVQVRVLYRVRSMNVLAIDLLFAEATSVFNAFIFWRKSEDFSCS